ncbi:MAG: rhomboid family intramembrane serine protease [Pirellulaceae bacterium]
MRQVGQFEDGKFAQRFSDYLETQGIRCQADEDEGSWTVWVRDENQVAQANWEFDEFLQNPSAERYLKAAKEAKGIRDHLAKRRAEAAKNNISMRQRWHRPIAQKCPLTMAILGACILLALLTGFGSGFEQNPDSWIARNLLMTNYAQPSFDLAEIKHGQIWRLLTPIFLHGSPAHLVFNMLMAYQFGIVLEFRHRSWFLALLVVITGVAGNVLQYLATGYPIMLGFSGVVYGMFGFVWAKQMFDPTSGYRIPDSSVWIMMLWLILGFAGILDSMTGANVANWAHLGGLVAGMAIAFAPTIGKPAP